VLELHEQTQLQSRQHEASITQLQKELSNQTQQNEKLENAV